MKKFSGTNIISLDQHRNNPNKDPIAPPDHLLEKHRQDYSEMWFLLGEIAKNITDIQDSKTLLEANLKINELHRFITQHTK